MRLTLDAKTGVEKTLNPTSFFRLICFFLRFFLRFFPRLLPRAVDPRLFPPRAADRRLHPRRAGHRLLLLLPPAAEEVLGDPHRLVRQLLAPAALLGTLLRGAQPLGGVDLAQALPFQLCR